MTWTNGKSEALARQKAFDKWSSSLTPEERADYDTLKKGQLKRELPYFIGLFAVLAIWIGGCLAFILLH